jgi:hypothetical protein
MFPGREEKHKRTPLDTFHSKYVGTSYVIARKKNLIDDDETM